ncbi:MAG: DUF3047 domain-containing protein [bacterium]|nr:DUF3047 domain-containing protein [bacterium]MDT8366107.1 DUF3047 domain-containing protein [bacterium]
MGVSNLMSKQALGAAMAAAALAILASGVLQSPAPVFGDPSGAILFREEFNTLEKWKPLKFRNIENMSSYTLDQQEDGESFVKAHSSSSASGMIWLNEFHVYEYPLIRWRWKVSNVYSKGDALQKAGDDYPVRIYVIFKYDTKDPRVKKKFKYGLAKLLYGEYPFYSSLNYIWANREHQQRFIPNPFAKEAIMIPLRSGFALAGQWLTEERNILEDYREAFGEDPPATAGLAFMNDSDNTGEASESWIDWIEIFRDQNVEPRTQNTEVEK